MDLDFSIATPEAKKQTKNKKTKKKKNKKQWGEKK